MGYMGKEKKRNNLNILFAQYKQYFIIWISQLKDALRRIRSQLKNSS
jgi:hypothetical protein